VAQLRNPPAPFKKGGWRLPGWNWAQPFRLTINLDNPFDDAGARGAPYQWDSNDSSPGPLHDIPADNLFLGPIGALDQYVRLQSFNEEEGIGLVEEDHVIDEFQGGQDFGPVFLGDDRPFFPFDLFHRPVGIQADDQNVALLLGFSQIPDMPTCRISKQPLVNTTCLPRAFKRATMDFISPVFLILS